MLRYRLSQFSSAIIAQAERELSITPKSAKPFCGYGIMDESNDSSGQPQQTILLPRFYRMPGLALKKAYAKIYFEPHVASPAELSLKLHTIPPQVSAATAALNALQPTLGLNLTTPQSAVLSLRQGFGRIVTALFVASSLGYNTIVVTHNQDRKESWLQGIKECIHDQEKEHQNMFTIVSQNELETFRFSSSNYGLLILDDVDCMDLQNTFAKHINLWSIPRILSMTKSREYSSSYIEYSVGKIIFDSEVVWKDSSMHLIPDCLEDNKHPHYIRDSLYHISKGSLSNEDLKTIRKDLTMEPREYGSSSSSGDQLSSGTFDAYSEDNTYFHVPRFYGIEKYGMPDDKNILVSKGSPMQEDVVFQGTLRTEPPQQEGHDIAVNIANTNITSGTLLSYYCGAGKTVLALSIAASLHVRTIILVHTNDLLEQWILRIGTFLPNARVGRIQQNKCVVDDMDIVVGMIQSISSRDYPREKLNTFGFCIVDECHRIACCYFSQSLLKINAAHVLGLSATPYRKDGLERLMRWSCGPIRKIVHRPEVKVYIDMVEYNTSIKYKKKRDGTPNRSFMLTKLAEEERRNQLLLLEIRLAAIQGRSILVLCDRLVIVKWLKNRLAEDVLLKYEIGQLTGSIAPKKRNEQNSKQIILATYGIAREGLDIPRLDTLIFATPIADVVQAVGRILRHHSSKQTPLVIDIWDQIDPFKGTGHARQRFYRKNNYIIRSTKIDQDRYDTLIHDLCDNDKRDNIDDVLRKDAFQKNISVLKSMYSSDGKCNNNIEDKDIIALYLDQ